MITDFLYLFLNGNGFNKTHDCPSSDCFEWDDTHIQQQTILRLLSCHLIPHVTCTYQTHILNTHNQNECQSIPENTSWHSSKAMNGLSLSSYFQSDQNGASTTSHLIILSKLWRQPRRQKIHPGHMSCQQHSMMAGYSAVITLAPNGTGAKTSTATATATDNMVSMKTTWMTYTHTEVYGRALVSIWNLKKHNSDILSHNCKIGSHNSEILSRNCKIISQNCDLSRNSD